MKRSLLKRKLFALAIGIVTALLLIEIGLRVAGRATHANPEKTALQISTGAKYLVLCTGDSHTKGKGAPEGFDYPSQLAALFKTHAPGIAFEVVNLGHAGSNSSEAVNQVRWFIQDSSKKPDLVIFQAGKNNEHNFRQASIITDLSLEGDYRTWARYLLSNSRTYRLSQISIKRLSNLMQNSDGKGSLNHEEFLYTHGRREQKMLRKWVAKDIEALHQIMGGKILLLNYYIAVEWVDRAYKDASKQLNVPVANIQDFGFPRVFSEPNVEEYESRPDLHPNQKGYAIVARLVFDAIIENRLLPFSNSIAGAVANE